MTQIPQDKERFLEWFYEVSKQDRETHSNTLQSIEKSLNGYGRLWKLLKTDIGAVIALIVFIVSVIAPYFLIRTDIAVMSEKLDTVIKEVSGLQGSSKEFSAAVSLLDSRISKIEGALGTTGLLKVIKTQ